VDEVQTVWHEIQLENSSSLCWTPGPIVVTRDNVFTARDSIDFVRPSGNSLISLAIALDVQVGFTETTKRSDNTVEVLKHVYQTFEVTGHIVVKNTKDEVINVLITRNFSGQHKQPQQAKVSTNYTYDVVNPSNTISWEIQLQPKQSQELSHSYLVLRN